MWFGRRDRERQYRLNDTVLQSEQGKRELGIHVQSSCRAIRRKISRTNGILGFRYRNIDYKGSKMMLNVYKTLVSPQLEFCVQFWSLHFRMWGSLRGCRGDLPEWFQGWGIAELLRGRRRRFGPSHLHQLSKGALWLGAIPLHSSILFLLQLQG